MKIKARSRSGMKRVMIIALCWTLFAALSFINEYYFVSDLITWKKLTGSYDFWSDFTGYIILEAFGGI